MGMVVTIFLALAAATCSYSIGQGGPVAGLIFFTVLLIGAIIRIAAPKPEYRAANLPACGSACSQAVVTVPASTQ